MNSDFQEAWKIFDSLDYGDDLKTYDEFKKILECLSFDELKSFHISYLKLMCSLVSPNHICASYLILEGVVGYDDFLGYTEIVAAVPESVFQLVAKSPDHILEFPHFSGILKDNYMMYSAIPSEVGKAKFGNDWESFEESISRQYQIDLEAVALGDSTGYNIVSSALCTKLVPKLAEKFGDDTF